MPVTSPRSTATQRNTPPPVNWNNVEEWIRMVAQSVQLLFDGRINTVGEITFTLASTTTTLTDPRISPGSFIGLSPSNSDAAAESPFIVPGDGAAVITHTSAGTTRTFKYVILG